MKDLFDPIVSEAQQHESFKTISDGISHKGARVLLNEIYNSVDDIDGNFIQQFQSNGFDSRIWELYLTAVIQELEFDILRNHDRPDFEIEKNGRKYFIEAVTSNPPNNVPSTDKLTILDELKNDNIHSFMKGLVDSSLIRLAGGLWSKLQKKYWDLPWINDQPIILAIAPFHHSLSQWVTDAELINYLYGINQSWEIDAHGNLTIGTHTEKERSDDNKTIPSGFFNLENSEYISAVIYSNSGTVSKFNRMGKLLGHSDDKVQLIRTGNMFNHAPNAIDPIPFYYIVGENGPIENWRQGLAMHHNPNALHPIDMNLFPNIMHGFFKDHYYSYVPDFYPMNSETIVINNI